VGNAGDFDMQIDAVEARPGEAGAVTLEQRRGAVAGVLAVAEKAAGATAVPMMLRKGWFDASKAPVASRS
jgi:hypothetical protein